MADARIPRGYGRYQTPYNEEFEGQRPSLDQLGNLLPAPWLPTAAIDAVHDDNLVMQAGTWVGRINQTDHADSYNAVSFIWEAFSLKLVTNAVIAPAEAPETRLIPSKAPASSKALRDPK